MPAIYGDDEGDEDSILDDSNPCDVEQTEVSSADERITLDIQTYRNADAVAQWDVALVRWLYTILNVQVLESGPPALDSLDRVLLSQFRDRSTVCEMRQSQIYGELVESDQLMLKGKKKKAFRKAVTFLAKDLLSNSGKKSY